MEYNSQRNKMVIPEYGRIIQKMIEHACTLESREERNKAARTIIHTMGSMQTHLRDVEDFKHILWDHLFLISDFKLDVDSPYPMPSNETLTRKPKHLNYPGSKMRFRHYGKTLQMMVEKVAEKEDGPEKKFLTEILANFMKTSYIHWNRDTVDDDVIVNHLEILSKGKLKLDSQFRFKSNEAILAKLDLPQNRPFKQQKGGGKYPQKNNNFKKKRR
jgi:hypothetical protein